MGYDLCLPRQAKKPYYIESIRTGIYSLEELCFYLYHNICLIDDSIMNEKLLDWIRDELRLPRLYRQLYEQLEKREGAAFFVLPVFREAGYLTNQEMRDYQERLTKFGVQSSQMKQKLRGDALAKDKMFARAAWEYRQLLKHRDTGKLGAQFYASVWNSLGAALAGLFQFREAADCFQESWKLMKTKDTFRKYISALPLFLSEDEYREKLKELQADEYLVSRIQEYNAKVCREAREQMEAPRMQNKSGLDILRDLKEEYAKSTQM